VEVPIPQQDNGSDCGVFVLLCAEIIAQRYYLSINNPDVHALEAASPRTWYDEGDISRGVGPAQAALMRGRLRDKITDIISSNRI
jgi:Ulp1 family protease